MCFAEVSHHHARIAKSAIGAPRGCRHQRRAAILNARRRPAMSRIEAAAVRKV